MSGKTCASHSISTGTSVAIWAPGVNIPSRVFLRLGWCAGDVWIERGVVSQRTDQCEMSEVSQVIDEQLFAVDGSGRHARFAVVGLVLVPVCL